MSRDINVGLRLRVDNTGAVRALGVTREEIARIERETRRASGATRTVTQRFQDWRRSLMTARSALGALGIGVSIAGLNRLAQSAINVGDSIDKAARAAGLGAESFQELRFALSQLANVTNEQVGTALAQFQTRLGRAAEGSGQASETFGQLGVTLQGVGGRLRGTEDVLEDVITALAGIEHDATRSARAAALFGDRVGPQLAAAIGEGTEAVERLRREARESGAVLGQDLVTGAAEARSELDRMRTTLGMRFTSLILENRDAIMALAGAVETLVGGLATAIERFVEFGEALGTSAGQAAINMQLDTLNRQIDAGVEGIAALREEQQLLEEADTEGASDRAMESRQRRLDQIAEEIEQTHDLIVQRQVARDGLVRFLAEEAGITEDLNKLRVEEMEAITVTTEAVREHTDALADEVGALKARQEAAHVDLTAGEGSIADLRRRIDQQVRLNSALGDGADAYQAMRREIEAENAVRTFRESLVDSEIANIDDLAATYRELVLELQDLESEYENLSDGLGGVERQMANMLDNIQREWGTTCCDVLAAGTARLS